MRLYGDKKDIDYNNIENFFKNRAGKYDEGNPYAVTMYQDEHPEIVVQRNEMEIKTLLPKADMKEDSVVLDLACGIGRWADAIKVPVDTYYGIDFSKDLIRIAKKRNQKENFYYFVSPAQQIKALYEQNALKKWNRLLIIGILIYLNDKDVEKLFNDLLETSGPDSLIIIREPMALVERLTLKDFYSAELKQEYNAIYRNREEIMALFDNAKLLDYFDIVEEDFLFEGKLNNRSETSQYYFILKKKH